MKVRPSVKPICSSCKVVKRNGKVGVIVDSDGSYHTVKLKDENENEYYESFYSDELEEY